MSVKFTLKHSLIVHYFNSSLSHFMKHKLSLFNKLFLNLLYSFISLQICFIVFIPNRNPNTFCSNIITKGLLTRGALTPYEKEKP